MKKPDETAPNEPQGTPLKLSDSVGGPPQTNVRAEVAAVLSQPESKVEAMFRDPRRAFLIVEDDPRATQKIVLDLKVRRGTQDQQIDPGVISVESVTGASNAIDFFLKEDGPSKITVILDIEFPFQDGGPPTPQAGHSVLKEITEKVKTWNEIHKDNPIALEIIINSTTVRTLDQAKALGAVSFSRQKDKAGEVVADYLKTQNS